MITEFVGKMLPTGRNIGGTASSTERTFANCNCTKVRNPHPAGSDFTTCPQAGGAILVAIMLFLLEALRERGQEAVGRPSQPATQAGASVAKARTSSTEVIERRME
jgi:hypothetical protein